MADIRQEFGPDSIVTFTAVTDRGKEWLRQEYHETSVRFDISNYDEKLGADRLSNRAIGDGLVISPGKK